jgi:hypothetical protein
VSAITFELCGGEAVRTNLLLGVFREDEKMSSEQAIRDVAEYNKLPSTPEKDEIDRMILNDEIGHFDFYCKAREYLQKVKQDTA